MAGTATDKTAVNVTWLLHRRIVTSTVAVLELFKYIIIYSLIFIIFTLFYVPICWTGFDKTSRITASISLGNTFLSD